MFRLLESDISSYDLFQLSEWIRRCRDAIKRSNYSKEEEGDTQYIRDATSFAERWRNKKKQLYGNDNYNRAVILSQIQLPKVFLIMENQFSELGLTKSPELEITEIIRNSIFNNEAFNHSLINGLVDKFKEASITTMEEYDKLFDALKELELDQKQEGTDEEETGKEETDEEEKVTIYEKVKELAIYKYPYNIIKQKIVLNDEQLISNHSSEELLKMIKDELDLKKCEISVIEYEESRLIEPEEAKIEFTEKRLRKNLNGSDERYYKLTDVYLKLEDFNIRHTRRSEYFRNEDKVYERNFFINLGFYFGLDIERFELFLNLHGYSLRNSFFPRDEIIRDGVNIGLGHNYTNVILKANGYGGL